MSKSRGYILTAELLLCAVVATRAQTGLGAPMGMPTSPELEELQKKQEQLIKEADPELADYQEKMQGVEAEIAKVTKSFAAKEIDKDEAKAELLPLIKEEQELRDDPDFQAEQMLSQAAFSSPEFQKKMAKISEKMNKVMQNLMAKQMRRAQRGRPGATRPAPATGSARQGAN